VDLKRNVFIDPKTIDEQGVQEQASRRGDVVKIHHHAHGHPCAPTCYLFPRPEDD
jgi:hypothetical protein